jgi:hypothetical protein
MTDYNTLIAVADDDVKRGKPCSFVSHESKGLFCRHYLDFCDRIITCPYKKRKKEHTR